MEYALALALRRFRFPSCLVQRRHEGKLHADPIIISKRIRPGKSPYGLALAPAQSSPSAPRQTRAEGERQRMEGSAQLPPSRSGSEGHDAGTAGGAPG